MLNDISSLLWLFNTFFLIIIAVFLTIYFNFTNFKVLKSVNKLSKEDIKLLNLSLAGKIGVGSISGIAIAIIIGGKGSLFWIWISSLLFSIFTYLESKTGVIYRKDKIGGPFLYIRDELKNNKLSKIYSILIIFTFLFSFILIQSNTIIMTWNNSYMIDKKLILLILIIIISISINKGIKRISNLVSILVPIMSLLYILIGVFVIYKNIYLIPSLLIDIVTESIKIKSLISIPLIVGFQRSIFSNEFGMGTTSMIVALSSSKDYNKEYFFQVIGMYFISLVICTISAFIILTSNYNQLNISNINGIEIINYAFSYHFENYGLIISSIIISLFAFSTIITSFYYGDISIKFLFRNKNNTVAKLIVIIVLISSLFIKPLNIWALVDITTALTTMINIYSLVKIRKKIKER